MKSKVKRLSGIAVGGKYILSEYLEYFKCFDMNMNFLGCFRNFLHILHIFLVPLTLQTFYIFLLPFFVRTLLEYFNNNNPLNIAALEFSTKLISS